MPTEKTLGCLTADWPAPRHVRTLITTRNGGVSTGPFHSLNLGDHVGDNSSDVFTNRALLRRELPAEPAWLNQVHGVTVLNAADVGLPPPNGDASFTRQRQVVCVVMTADCLPLLLSNEEGTVVAAAHVGWRGLRDGVMEATVAACNERPGRLMAWLGPAIGPKAFEVGESVRTAFMDFAPSATAAFIKISNGKYQADIRTLARQRLNAAGVEQIYSSKECTVIDRERFFSYRRDGQTGRMASLIWLE